MRLFFDASFFLIIFLFYNIIITDALQTKIVDFVKQKNYLII